MFSALRQLAERTVSSRSSTRAKQDRIDLVFLLDYHWFAVTFEVDERSQLLLQNGCSAANSLFRIQSTVGFQINNQLVQVSTLLDTGVSTTYAIRRTGLNEESSCKRPMLRLSSSSL
jgi:hypothetical protein